MKILAFLFTWLVCCSAFAEIVTKSVPYEHAGAKLEGFLAYDDAAPTAPKRPGVLVVHEWWGLNDYVKDRARQLAQMGYVAFAVDMYGGGKSTGNAKEAQAMAAPFFGKSLMADRAQAGLDQLVQTGLVDEKKVAAIGFCFGGSTCQALAFSGAKLAGIVSFHGGLVQPQPDGLSKAAGVKFLLLNGAIDPMVKNEDIAAFTKALDKAHIDYQWTNYSGALHAFTNPNATKLAEKNNLTAAVGYNELAATRAWAQMALFFDEIFR